VVPHSARDRRILERVDESFDLVVGFVFTHTPVLVMLLLFSASLRKIK
jgi:hypothetical protein